MTGRVIEWPVVARPVGADVDRSAPSATVVILPVMKPERCGCYMCAASRADPSDLVDRIAGRMRKAKRYRWPGDPDDSGPRGAA